MSERAAPTIRVRGGVTGVMRGQVRGGAGVSLASSASDWLLSAVPLCPRNSMGWRALLAEKSVGCPGYPQSHTFSLCGVGKCPRRQVGQTLKMPRNVLASYYFQDRYLNHHGGRVAARARRAQQRLAVEGQPLPPHPSQPRPSRQRTGRCRGRQRRVRVAAAGDVEKTMGGSDPGRLGCAEAAELGERRRSDG